MADPKPPPGKGGEPPFPPPSFPAPRRREEPSPYRQGAVPTLDAPVKRVEVTRPEPPPDFTPPKPRPAPQHRPPPPPLESFQSATPRMNPAMAWLLSRFPRGVATVWTSLFLYSFESSVVGDLRKVHEALITGQKWVRVTKTHVLQGTAAAVGAGLWVMIAGIPIEDATGRPPDWWYLGLAGFVVSGFALQSKLAALMISLFA